MRAHILPLAKPIRDHTQRNQEPEMRAIDMHAHVPRQPGLDEMVIEGRLREFFRLDETPTLEQMVETYESLDVLAVIFSVDAETRTGDAPDSNDYVAGIVAQHPDRFIGFSTVDPWKGAAAVDELERAVTDLGLSGLKLHPIHQAFFPNDEQFYPLWQKCSDLGVPAVFHTGYGAAGSGMPGGGGFKLGHAQPIPYIDDIAADFPELTIVMAHPAWPWIDQQIAVALHKPNVYIDLSGWAPKYIPADLIREANSRLRNKVLFGSDYPYMPPQRWLEEFEVLEMRDEVRPLVLLDNARKILGLE